MSSTDESEKYSEPSYAAANDKNNKELPWYSSNIDKHLRPEIQNLLETYSGIPRAKQSEHVHKIRDEAFAIRTYPCTGLGVFLDPYIAHSPAYAAVLERLKAGGSILDVGCLLGGDLRKLAFDGAPSDKMYAVDIVSHWDVGFNLFNDRDRFKAHFIEADVLTVETNPELQVLKGSMDIISVSAVLHQWNWNDQVDAAKKLVAFSKPGSLVVGHQIGNLEGKEILFQGKFKTWRHDPASFARLWDQVGEETGTKWETQAKLVSWEEMGWEEAGAFMMEGDRVIDFVVTRQS